VGLAAWIVEKFRPWSDCGGDIERRFSKDVLLTTVMLYWVTGAINSSFWPYRRHEPWPINERTSVRVPTAYASFPREILHPPRAWVEQTYPNILCSHFSSGGFQPRRMQARSAPEGLTQPTKRRPFKRSTWRARAC
jgi:hypothetical protein